MIHGPTRLFSVVVRKRGTAQDSGPMVHEPLDRVPVNRAMTPEPGTLLSPYAVTAKNETGTTLGPYEVATKIGEGGMGEVYRARDTKFDQA